MLQGLNVRVVLLLACVLCGPPLLAAGDPCNFNDGSIAFEWQRVMDCYHSVPFHHDDLVNAVAFISAARERSDEREIFDQRHGWRSATAALDDPTTKRDYPSDFAMQLAIVGNHKEFLNPHWRYRRPGCYTLFLGAVMPFDFGSDVTGTRQDGTQQIFFIEDAPFLPDLYRDFTGIDARRHIGMRIVTINDVEPGAYFRRWGRTVLRFDANDGEHLNEVLQSGAYSMRVSTTHDLPPRRAADDYLLEAASGKRVSVTMPWIFVPRESFGLPQWPLDSSESTDEFHERCRQPSSVAIMVDSFPADRADAPDAPDAPDAFDIESHAIAGGSEQLQFTREIMAKRNTVKTMYRSHGRSSYLELPPGQAREPIEIVIPHTNGAEVKQLGEHATIIRLDEFISDWKATVIAGTGYACENSERLLFDMRGNGGGFVSQFEWLVTHLFPDRDLPIQYGIAGRFLASNPGRTELSERMGRFAQTVVGDGVCYLGYEAACFVDPQTGFRRHGLDWMVLDTVNETRAGLAETLTSLVSFSNTNVAYAPGLDPIACPGKFQDHTLIVLSNGTGASAGHFFPEQLRRQATIVTAGGFVGEPLVSGIARGGAVWGMNEFEAWTEQWFQRFVFGPATDPLPYLVRDVESFVEQPAAYFESLDGLYVNDVPVGDLHIDVWTDSPASDGHVYKQVIRAVEKTDPASGE